MHRSVPISYQEQNHYDLNYLIVFDENQITHRKFHKPFLPYLHASILSLCAHFRVTLN